MSYAEHENIRHFFIRKSPHSIALFNHFVQEFEKLGPITLHPTKTMIAVDNGQHRIAWITQVGRNFIHVVFPFKQPYEDNLCFQKIAPVTGSKQFNHHLRLLLPDDVNDEVKRFMLLALHSEK